MSRIKPKDKKLPKTVVTFQYQTGRVKDILADASRSALTPGKRISSSGSIYWESRRNRSDVSGKNI
jgi:hypothetical protein